MDAILENTFFGYNSTMTHLICSKFCTKMQSLTIAMVECQKLSLRPSGWHIRWYCYDNRHAWKTWVYSFCYLLQPRSVWFL